MIYLYKLAYIASFRSKQRLLSARLAVTMVLGNFISAFIAFIIYLKSYNIETVYFMFFVVIAYFTAFVLVKRGTKTINVSEIDNEKVISKRTSYTLLFVLIGILSALSILGGIILGDILYHK